MEVAERARADECLPGAARDGAGRCTRAVSPPLRPEPAGERMTLNLFFEEKDDRWLPGDRHVRPLLRRLVYGRPRISGQERVFLNLCAGLDRLGIRYRVNDYRYIRKHPDEVACIIGRRFVLDWMEWKNPILLGVAMYNHPVDDPDLFVRLPVKKVLVPSEWYAEMCRSGWPDVEAWPVGIDTEAWRPAAPEHKTVDVLLYNKVQWERDRYAVELVEPIREHLRACGRSFEEISYGSYREQDYQAALARCRTMIFLCQHESQGIAYQQALASNVPVFAWDGGGAWQDPDYFPHKVRFEGVSSVPYWDDRCGMKFIDTDSFRSRWDEFWRQARAGAFGPRDYVLDELTLEKRALQYYEFARSVMQRELR